MRGRQREMVADWRKEEGGVRRTKRILNKTQSMDGEKRRKSKRFVLYNKKRASKGYFQLNVMIYKSV